jgi:hypothetical protein
VVDQIREDLQGYYDTLDYVKQNVDLAGGWRFSWDNAGHHKFSPELLEARGMQTVPLPPYSPDLHCVVEHAVGRTWGAFLKARRALPRKAQPDDYIDVLLDSFSNANQAPTIASDVLRLPEIYKVISTSPSQDMGKYKGSLGDWPHPRLYH